MLPFRDAATTSPPKKTPFCCYLIGCCFFFQSLHIFLSSSHIFFPASKLFSHLISHLFIHHGTLFSGSYSSWWVNHTLCVCFVVNMKPAVNHLFVFFFLVGRLKKSVAEVQHWRSRINSEYLYGLHAGILCHILISASTSFYESDASFSTCLLH